MLEGILGGVVSVFLYLFLALVGLWIWFQWRHRKLIRMASKLPCAIPPWPIIGHGYTALWNIPDLTKFVMDLTWTSQRLALKTACFWIGPWPLIVVHDLDDIKIVLNSSMTLNKSDEYQMLKSGLDTGKGPLRYSIITAPVSDWKIRRRYLSSLVHDNNLRHLVTMFNRNSREMVERMKKHEGRGSFDIMEYSMDTALKSVCDLMFGAEVDVDVNTEEFRGLKRFVETVPSLFIMRLLFPWLRSERIFKFMFRKRLKEINAFWKAFSKTPIQIAEESSERKAKQNTHVNENLKSTSNIQERLSIIDVFNAMQKKFPQYTDVDLRGDMLTFYSTGSDSVGATVSACFMALAQYQDIQEKLYSEIISVVGNENDVTLDDISRMPYLDQVVKETLRRFSIVPFILKTSDQDLKLSTCVIPAGYSMVISLSGLLLDPKIYPDPFKFDPERFSPENAVDSNSNFLPFGGGPRNCLAKTYAIQLTKVMVVHVLRKFRLRTQADVYKLKMKLVITYISAEGYPIMVEDRMEKCDKQ